MLYGKNMYIMSHNGQTVAICDHNDPIQCIKRRAQTIVVGMFHELHYCQGHYNMYTAEQNGDVVVPRVINQPKPIDNDNSVKVVNGVRRVFDGQKWRNACNGFDDTCVRKVRKEKLCCVCYKLAQ